MSTPQTPVPPNDAEQDYLLDEEASISSTGSELDDGSRRGRKRLDTVPRRCTDCGWIFIFLSANAFLVYLALINKQHDGWKHTWLLWDGKLCSIIDSETPFSFFCARRKEGNASELLLDWPICIGKCPNITDSICDTGRNSNFAAVEGLQTYRSIPFNDELCMPYDKPLRAQWQQWVVRNYFKMYLSLIKITGWALMVSATASFVLSIAYLYFLHNFTGYVVWLTAGILVVVPFVVAAACGYCWYQGGCGDQLSQDDSFGIAVASLLIGITLYGLVKYNLDAFNQAIQVITESARCMFEEKGLIFEAVSHVALRLVSVSIMLPLIMGLRTIGGDQHNTEGSQTRSGSSGHILYLCFTTFMFLWQQYFIAAISSFTICYVTELWYFDVKTGDRFKDYSLVRLSRAWWLILRYHGGTLAFGALLLGVTQPFRFLLGFLHGIANMKGNCVSFLISQVFSCLLDLSEWLNEMISNTAWMEVVLHAEAFAAGSRRSLEIVRGQESTVSLLHGVTAFFKCAGIAVTMYIATLITLSLVESHEEYTNPASRSFILVPHMVCIAAALFAGVVAHPFHFAYDTVGNAILYCWIVHSHSFAKSHKEEDGSFSRSCFGGIGGLAYCGLSIRPGKLYPDLSWGGAAGPRGPPRG